MDTFRAAGTKRGHDEHLSGEPKTDSPRKKTKTLDNPAGQVLDGTAAGDQAINTRASDPANTYAPDATTPALRAAYLQEVGDRDLYFTRTPQETPSSSVKQIFREIIFGRLFCGWPNEQCVETYKARGGEANSAQGVSKLYLKHCPTWIEEENVVMPWNVRSKSDRKRLEGLGLTAEHFPFFHRLSAKAMAAIGGATKGAVERKSKGKADAKPVTQTSTAKNREQTAILQDDGSP
jgi:hypothetical protein